MRVLIHGLNFAPELTGIGKYTGDLARYLVEEGHSVRAVTTPPYYPQWKIWEGYSGWNYQSEQWQGVEVYRCPLWVPENPTGLKRMLHLASFATSSFPVTLWQSVWKPDIVFAVAPTLLSVVAATLVTKLVGGKSWLHIQDFELNAAFDLGILPAKKVLYPIATRLEKMILSQFDQVSTISNRMLEWLYLKGVSRERAVLFPNWVDIKTICPLPDDASLRQELGIPHDQIVVLYSGNMGRKQGLENLVEAARLIAADKKILFVLCGDGMARRELEQRAAGLSNIRFLPLQSLDRLNALLNLADIHVLPQRADAADLVMPSKLSGMLASGRVVVVTARAGTELAQVVENIGCVIEPNDVCALVKTIQKLANCPEDRIELGNRGRLFVETAWAREEVLGSFVQRLNQI